MSSAIICKLIANRYELGEITRDSPGNNPPSVPCRKFLRRKGPPLASLQVQKEEAKAAKLAAKEKEKEEVKTTKLAAKAKEKEEAKAAKEKEKAKKKANKL